MSSLIHTGPAPAEISDEVAVAEVARGNREMFEIVVRRHNQRLYRIGMSYLRDHGHTEDAMQNAYVKAFVNVRKFNGSSSFATWLTRIMINECLMILRQPRRKLESVEVEAVEKRDASPSADAQMNAKEMKTILEQSIRELPQSYRVVYILREVQQLSTEETAQSLDLTVQNVKVTLHRAREKLKTSLLRSAAGTELFAYTAEWCDPMTARVMRAVSGLGLL
jgi:RNA polymerase sigma-70 factor (ECF subfamily)